MKKQVLLLASVFFLFAGLSCYKKVAVPTADFSFHGSNDTLVPDTVTFRNLSENASSTETNPVHIYTIAASYTVVLKAYSSNGEQWGSKSRKVIIQ